MMHIAGLCFATIALGAAKPIPAATPQLRADTKGGQVQTTTAPRAQVAFRTGADGVTRPLEADVGALVKLNNDGFTLKVEKKGDNANFPKRGDLVTVHYTGMLKDGTIFDSSRERGEPLSFPVGLGKVIRGWDQGVVTMSLGERAMLHLPSYKAYGTSGAPPAIPPNAELDFDIELLAINGQTVPKPPCTSPASSGSIDTKEKCKDACTSQLGGGWYCPGFQTFKVHGGTHFKCSCSNDNCKNKWDTVCEDQGIAKADAPNVKPAATMVAVVFMAIFTSLQQ